MEVKFTPLGLTGEVSAPVQEDRRPECCPDRIACKPILVFWQTDKEQLDKGYSGSCWGYCGERRFIYGEAEHRNDLSHCVITPLKGVIRFFTVWSDLGNDSLELRRLLYMLSPNECEECKTSRIHENLTSYIIQREPELRRWLCLGCAVRLGVVEFHSENIGTGRAVYY